MGETKRFTLSQYIKCVQTAATVWLNLHLKADEWTWRLWKLEGLNVDKAMDNCKGIVDFFEDFTYFTQADVLAFLAWVNHLEHASEGNFLLYDYGKIPLDIINRISQEGIEAVFPDWQQELKEMGIRE